MQPEPRAPTDLLGPSRAPSVRRASTIAAQFARQLSRDPDACAVIAGERRLSYRELDERAEQLAQRLLALGVAPEECVAVGLERSLELVVALLAVLKAGAAYLPFDPAHPSERVRFMFSDASVRILLTTRRHAEHGAELAHVLSLDELDATQPAQPRAIVEEGEPLPSHDAPSASSSLAYVCYTSGSTGKPKGVEVTHAGVLRLVCDVGYVALGPGRVVLHAAPSAFDATTFELWGPLLTGGTTVLFPPELPTANTLRELIARHGITTAFLTTALVNAVVDDDARALAGLSQLLFGGEAVSVGHIARLQAACPELALVHVYGPTETTTFATAYALRERVDASASTIPIGHAIEETTLHVLDAELAPVPPGEAGELYIGGAGVARGYLNRPELTKERFVRAPATGDRLYRSGDVVRANEHGELMFVGRVDHQVKIRGHRIELGEIEARLAQIAGIRACVVLCREERPGDKRLVAYYVSEQGVEPSSEFVRAELARELPAYMVPRHYLALERFPLTANGKIDRARLPPPSSLERAVVRAPERAVERELGALWCTLLGIDALNVDDDFFALGGHSLLATRLLARVRDRFGVELSLTALFEEPTIEAMAPRIESILYLRDASSGGGATSEEFLI